MRTIKFRGKRVDNGKWIYGDLCTFNSSDCEICDWGTIDCSRYDVDPETVGQFTGICDLDYGTEIYEGDVVLKNCRKYVVTYIRGCYWLVNNDDVPCYRLDEAAAQINVIGNIYDSDELPTDEITYVMNEFQAIKEEARLNRLKEAQDKERDDNLRIDDYVNMIIEKIANKDTNIYRNEAMTFTTFGGFSEAQMDIIKVKLSEILNVSQEKMNLWISRGEGRYSISTVELRISLL